MANRNENLKKINSELEKLTDEQLEQVAGGIDWIPPSEKIPGIVDPPDEFETPSQKNWFYPNEIPVEYDPNKHNNDYRVPENQKFDEVFLKRINDLSNIPSFK